MVGVVSHSKGRHRWRYGSRRRCVLGYPFQAIRVLYDRFRRRCPTAVRGLSLQTFGREVRSLGFPTAHRRRGNCYRVVEV